MIYRQGDVLVQSIDSIPPTASRKKPKRIILAYGEVTGHCHEIADVDNIELYEEEGRMFLRVNDEANLSHQEHATITLARGTYEVIRQREYTPEEIRNVAD